MTEAFPARGPATAGRAPLRVGLIGFGVAGSAFHAPLIAAAEGLTLTSIVTSDPGRAGLAADRYPAAQVLPDADALFAAADEHDLVAVASPNRFHVGQALAAVEAGLHVVVDKPVAPRVSDARRLAAAARERGVVAAAFHNRRWDGDALTVRRLLGAGALGDLWRLESRFERWRPEVDLSRPRERADPEDAGGVLFDLGSHLIDQAMWLLGRPRSVYAEIERRRPGAVVDDDVFLALDHVGGRAHLWMGMAVAQPGPRFRVLGSRAAYVKYGLDGQEAALRTGELPDAPGFGEEPPERWGLLGTEEAGAGAMEPVPTEPGRYLAFYEQMAEAVLHGGPPPVPLEDAIACLEVIEAARESAAAGDVRALG